MAMVHLKLRPAKIEEISPEAQVGILGAFLNLGKQGLFKKLTLKPRKTLSLELYSLEQKTQFYLTAEEQLASYFASQFVSHFPKTLASLEKSDPLALLYKTGFTEGAYLSLATSFIFPIKTYKETKELPPLASVLGYLAKMESGQGAVIQILVRVPSQKRVEHAIRSAMKYKTPEGTEASSPYTKLFNEKLSAPFLECQIRLAVSSPLQETAKVKLNELSGSFGAYTQAEGNALVVHRTANWRRRKWWRAIGERTFSRAQSTIPLNLQELASIWHLPDESLSGIKAIDWGKQIASEAPDNLPVAERYTNEEAKREINFFGRTEWRNHEAIFGINREDRRKHIYVIGKTGSGKTTMLANMAISDIRNGEGVAVIDPHGDLSEMILNFVPKRRVNDVIYLDPTLAEERSFALNLFDSEGTEHTDVVASGIISVFYKLYHNSWGPRLEYILRNAILTLLYYEEATFVDIIKLLTERNFRLKVIEKIKNKDPIIAAFWTEEFEKMNDKLRIEAISPILNKVGQFLSSQRIRHIVGSRRSTFSFDEVMNNKKILILNLSQGKLGEDTTALLGAMFITKMQLTAMRRVNRPEDQRPDFYLYVDEFQNFATTSFVKILSEARKYRLNLVLANQYIGQVDEEIQKAIFGNVGSMVSFVVGARDASFLEKEFGGKFTIEDMVALGKFEILVKQSIEGLTSEPFVAHTLPLPAVVNNNRDKILVLGLERYYQKFS